MMGAVNPSSEAGTPPLRTAIALVLLICAGAGIAARCAESDPVQVPAQFAFKRHRAHYPPEVLLQAFTWDATVDGQKYIWYRSLQPKVAQLAADGVTHVWLPPPSRSVAPQGYMPGDYYDLGHGDALGTNRTLYGNEAELKACIAAFKKKGIACLADLVLNHRCASHQENGLWNVYHFPSNKAVWEKWALVGGDYGGTGNPDTGEDFNAAPDVDHTEPRVRADIIAWMRWLQTDVGFNGWRFDFTKGYGPQYVREYVTATDPEFAVGEYWTSMNYHQDQMDPLQDPHRQRLKEWVVGTGGTCTAFDFTTKGLLQEALHKREYWRLKDQNGRAAGLMGWAPEAAVTGWRPATPTS
jgi:alpha-amylase